MLSGTEVARQLLTTIFTVCKEWLQQFPSLTAPAHTLEISMFGIKNTRRKMEDRYALCLDVNSLYGLQVLVVDGSVYHSSCELSPLPRECHVRVTMRCVMDTMERRLQCTLVFTC